MSFTAYFEFHDHGLNDAQAFVVWTFMMWVVMIIVVIGLHLAVPGNMPSAREMLKHLTHNIADEEDEKQIQEEYQCDWNTLGKSPSGQ